jgi:hypothetical protein
MATPLSGLSWVRFVENSQHRLWELLRVSTPPSGTVGKYANTNSQQQQRTSSLYITDAFLVLLSDAGQSAANFDKYSQWRHEVLEMNLEIIATERVAMNARWQWMLGAVGTFAEECSHVYIMNKRYEFSCRLFQYHSHIWTSVRASAVSLKDFHGRNSLKYPIDGQ